MFRLRLNVTFFSTPLCSVATAVALLPVRPHFSERAFAQDAPSAQAAPPGQGAPLGYQELLEKARAAHFASINGQTKVDLAKASAAIAEREGRANAQITSTLSGRLEPEGPRSGAGASSGRIDLGSSGDFALEHATVLGVNIPLWDGNRASSKQTTAQARLAEAQASLQERESELAQTVARICSRYLASVSLVALSDLQERLAATKYEEIRAAYRRGERSELDLTRAEFERARALINRDRARGDLQLLRRSIGSLINVTGAPPELKLATRSPEDWQAFEDRLKAQTLRSPGTERLQKQREALQAEIASLESSTNPQLNAQAGVGFGGQVEPLRTLATTQLQFVYPLPWNRATDSEKERLLLQLRALDEEASEDTRARTQRQLQALQALDLLRGERAALGQQLSVLQRYRTLMKRRFDAGRASALELGESEDQELAAKVDLQRVQSQISERILDLADAVGFSDYGTFFQNRG